ncbi:MAG TPA: hypothetical protein ENL34_12525 [Chloroflexi bacterium]|nr:hypothetical protein [Chloroflexota bacterium]
MAVAKAKITAEGHIPVGLEALERVYLRVGDEIEIEPVTRGVLLIKAWSLVQEEARLSQVKRKLTRIRDNLAAAEGLTFNELLLATQYGLIDPQQAYWWSEGWQAGEREVEREKEMGQVATFESVEALLADLHAQ